MMSLENNEVVGQLDMVTSHHEVIEQNYVNKQFYMVTTWHEVIEQNRSTDKSTS